MKSLSVIMDNPEIIIHIEVQDCLQDCPFSVKWTEYDECHSEDYHKWYCSRIASYPINTAFLILDGPNLPIIKPLHNCPFRK